MTLLILVLGLALSTLLNWFVARQWGNADYARWSLMPFVGALLRRDWVALAVDVVTVAMTTALWHTYGWSARFVLLLLATVVLIHTAAVDWKVRLIDTLVMLGATLAALVFAPLLAGTWLNALLGVLVAAMVFVLLFMLARILYPGQHAPFGLGDVYLGMFIGALVGITDVGAALLYGIVLAGLASVMLLVAHGYRQARHMPIAYGAFLCMGVLLHLVLQP
jgi:leader peptidase (prepilin peptidase)/N-methyltransferase